MKRMNKKMALLLLLLLMVGLLSVGLVAAGGDMLPRSLVSSGGGIVSQSGTTLQSAIGQPAVGAVENGNVLCSGYLCGAEAPPVSGGSNSVYLPVIIR